MDQKILNNTVREYQKALVLTQNRYRSGVAARTDVIQAQTQLATAQAQALNNGIARSQYEHAIAILTGQPPANFSLSFQPLTMTPPHIPLEIPSELLERRPDVAQAERLVAQANAQIGVAISAYFPSLLLNGTGSVVGNGYAHWFSLPNLAWSLGPQIAATFYDGGLRSATLAAAHATYDANVAAYRQTVLAAFQDVEDNLVSLRILKSQYAVQNQAAKDAKLALKLVMNQYKSGTVAYSDVITAQNTAYTAEKNAADVNGLRMTSAVGLIKALGGGWDAKQISTN
jgi:NodT family efflux transporter outer membrane factor (OMF) lipoprotein